MTLGQQGTLIIAAHTEYGIVIAADSRACFIDTLYDKNLPFAYYDSANKIFRLKQYLIAVAGANGIGDTYYSEIIKSYNKIVSDTKDIDQTLNDFLDYLNKFYPSTQFPSRNSNVFIVAGYENGIAAIISYHNGLKRRFENGSVVSDSTCKKYFDFHNKNQSLSVVDVIENTMIDFAKGEKKELVVGGPISSQLIKPTNEIIILKNDFSKNDLKSPTKLYERYLKGMFTINFVWKSGRQKFVDLFTK